MLTYKTFKELYEAYEKKEVAACIIAAIAYIELDIVDKLPSLLDEASVLTSAPKLLAPGLDLAPFMAALGGDVHICETKDDLKQIKGLNSEWSKLNNNASPDVTDAPLAWDVCDYVGGYLASGWVMFLLCSNNAGGHSYFVPEELWGAARVLEHTRTSDTPWEHSDK